MRSRTRARISATLVLALIGLPLSGSAPGLGRLLWTLDTGG
jgi:hypothetical protein